MTACTTPSAEDMLRQLKTYRRQAHKAKVHRLSSLVFLSRLHKQSQSGDEDTWQILSDHRKKEKTGVTGPLIKSAFRNYLSALQNNRCCYCRRWLNNIAHARPIDHILPKSNYPQFAIHFWNLALACYDCNEQKKRDDWGQLPAHCMTYPEPMAIEHFFHPRFHVYDEHVSFFRIETNQTYITTFKGISPQGKHLCSELLYIISGKETLCSNNPTLTGALSDIETFQQQSQADELPALAEFRRSLDTSILNMLKDGGA